MDQKIYNIVVLGNTGVGKSSLLNMLAGNQNAFIVGDRAYSETQLTIYKEIRLMGRPDGLKLRLVDTQGLSDSGGDTKDMDHIKNMVERIRELETIDLFLLCLDGTNPRISDYVRSTITLFSDIFPEFLYHSVLIFNKWTYPDSRKLSKLRLEYQNVFKDDYEQSNIPCFFIDSFFNLRMLRDNDDGTQSERELHPNIQARTHAQIVGLMSFLVSKSTHCNVKNIIAKDTKLTALSKEKEAAQKELQMTIQKNKEEIQNLRNEGEKRINEIKASNQDQINDLYRQLANAQRSGKKCIIL
jgi:GTPase Era involved in 16S rRNA processing